MKFRLNNLIRNFRSTLLWVMLSLALQVGLFALATTFVSRPEHIALQQGSPSFEAVFLTVPPQPEPVPVQPDGASVNPVVGVEEASWEVPIDPTPINLVEMQPVDLFNKPDASPLLEKLQPIELPVEVTERPAEMPSQEEAFSPLHPVFGVETEAKPEPIFQPSPRYPSIAVRRGLEGVVELAVKINPDGSPLSVRVSQSSGYSFFDQSALETVRDQWRFSHGTCQTGLVVVTMNFRLE